VTSEIQETRDLICVKQALNSWKRRDFNYGDADCCSFVAHVASELTGRDYRQYITYSSEREAYDLIESHGSFEALIDSVFGEPAEASDGDPVMLNLPIVGKMMGIKYECTAICITKFGLSQMPERYIIRSWSLCLQQ
jgi:hypothetical protein